MASEESVMAQVVFIRWQMRLYILVTMLWGPLLVLGYTMPSSADVERICLVCVNMMFLGVFFFNAFWFRVFTLTFVKPVHAWFSHHHHHHESLDSTPVSLSPFMNFT
jgi:hypothetical protein